MPTNKLGRDWIINERPDEMLKRYLKIKKKEIKLQMIQNKQYSQDECNDNSIIIGYQDLATQKTFNNTTFKTRELSEISRGKSFVSSLCSCFGVDQ